jgi:hypothetical protein
VCTKEKSEYNIDFADLRPLCEKNKIPYKFNNNVNSKDNCEICPRYFCSILVAHNTPVMGSIIEQGFMIFFTRTILP